MSTPINQGEWPESRSHTRTHKHAPTPAHAHTHTQVWAAVNFYSGGPFSTHNHIHTRAHTCVHSLRAAVELTMRPWCIVILLITIASSPLPIAQHGCCVNIISHSHSHMESELYSQVPVLDLCTRACCYRCSQTCLLRNSRHGDSSQLNSWITPMGRKERALGCHACVCTTIRAVKGSWTVINSSLMFSLCKSEV